MPNEQKPAVAAEPMEYLKNEHKQLENARAIVMQMWSLLTGEAGEGGYDEVKYLLDAIKSMEEFIDVEETGVKPGKGGKKAILATGAEARIAISKMKKADAASDSLTVDREALADIAFEIDELAEFLADAPDALQQKVRHISMDLKALYELESQPPAPPTPEMIQQAMLHTAGKLKNFLIPIFDELHAQKEALFERELTQEEEMALWQEAMKIGAARMKEYAAEHATPEPNNPNDPAMDPNPPAGDGPTNEFTGL
jgi:hypothetical protein